MAIKNLYINKLTLEDIELGVGNVVQTRGGKAVTLTKVNADNFPVNGDVVIVANIASDVTTNANNITDIQNASANAASALASANASSANVITTNADVATTNADVVLTNADVATTNADVVLTNADVATTNANVITTSTQAANAQLRAWEAEAEKMTADSYATEPENVFVKVYTSNGNGAFTATNTTEYSALHYDAKAGVSATSASNSAASVDTTKIIHTIGSGLSNEGYTKATTDATFETIANNTASSILTKIKTVDGPLSGLDADTVDGIQGALLAKVTDKNQCTAWLLFDGTTGIIRDSYNVISVTQIALGEFDLVIPLANINISYSVSGVRPGGFVAGMGARGGIIDLATSTASKLNLKTYGLGTAGSAILENFEYTAVIIFGGK